MIRVLQVVNSMHRAGLETVIMNYYREIDRTKIQFDFLTHRPGPSAYDAEIERLGGHIYKMPRLYPNNYVSYFKKMSKFFSEHPEYKIVHSHIDSMSFLPLLAAKRAGIPIRIAHSHNTSMDIDFKMPLKQLFKLGIPSVANQYFACGKDAGHFLFGDREFFVMKNSIDVQHFIFSEHKRIQVRKKMGIADNTLIIGNVGRLSYQKNQEFLLRAFNILVKKRKNIKLWLIGEGENEQRLLKMIKQLKIEKHVSMLGTRANVAFCFSVTCSPFVAAALSTARHFLLVSIIFTKSTLLLVITFPSRKRRCFLLLSSTCKCCEDRKNESNDNIFPRHNSKHKL